MTPFSTYSISVAHLISISPQLYCEWSCIPEHCPKYTCHSTLHFH